MDHHETEAFIKALIVRTMDCELDWVKIEEVITCEAAGVKFVLINKDRTSGTELRILRIIDGNITVFECGSNMYRDVWVLFNKADDHSRQSARAKMREVADFINKKTKSTVTQLEVNREA